MMSKHGMMHLGIGNCQSAVLPMTVNVAMGNLRTLREIINSFSSGEDCQLLLKNPLHFLTLTLELFEGRGLGGSGCVLGTQ